MRSRCNRTPSEEQHSFPGVNWAEAFAPKSGRYTAGSSASRCQINITGREAFVRALRQAKRLPKAERAALIEARLLVEPKCKGNGEEDHLAKLPAVRSSTGKAFRTYLASALEFYDGDFDAATIGFSSLAKARDKWLRETALYMIARSELNRSQAGAFGRYGFFDLKTVDKGAIANAERGFGLYLKKYPDGQYSGSARGLMRRVYWLSGNVAKLSAEYERAMDNAAVTSFDRVGLIEEMDDKLLPGLVQSGGADDPVLTAMILLYRMREPGYDFHLDGDRPDLTRADIEAMRPRFADHPRLFEYLQAVHAFYVAKNPAQVLKIIPDDARRSSYNYLDFSRQVLRGMALEATGDRNARGFWEQLIQGSNAHGQRAAVELALAMNLERGNALERVFVDGSSVGNQMMRDILLLRVAGPELLRRQAKKSEAKPKERDLALYTLLYKNLAYGNYADFLSDLSLVPDGANAGGPYFGYQYESGFYEAVEVPVGVFGRKIDYEDFDCPQLKRTVAALESNAKDRGARLCLADYFRIAGFDDYWLNSPADADELGGSKSRFSGEPLSRLEIYKDIIADRKTSANDRAYALYRAIWCYGPSGNNSCGGQEVPTSQRGAWFRQLKRNYPNSRWARQLKYYW